jgi:hypothetical protein
LAKLLLRSGIRLPKSNMDIRTADSLFSAGDSPEHVCSSSCSFRSLLNASPLRIRSRAKSNLGVLVESIRYVLISHSVEVKEGAHKVSRLSMMRCLFSLSTRELCFGAAGRNSNGLDLRVLLTTGVSWHIMRCNSKSVVSGKVW